MELSHSGRLCLTRSTLSGYITHPRVAVSLWPLRSEHIHIRLCFSEWEQVGHTCPHTNAHAEKDAHGAKRILQPKNWLPEQTSKGLSNDSYRSAEQKSSVLDWSPALAGEAAPCLRTSSESPEIPAGREPRPLTLRNLGACGNTCTASAANS